MHLSFAPLPPLPANRANTRNLNASRGKQIGSRKRYFDMEKAVELRRQDWGQIRIAKALGVGVGRVNTKDSLVLSWEIPVQYRALAVANAARVMAGIGQYGEKQ